MITVFIQTKSTVKGQISASWGHAPIKTLKMDDLHDAIRFARYLAAYSTCICRLTFKDFIDEMIVGPEGIVKK